MIVSWSTTSTELIASEGQLRYSIKHIFARHPQEAVLFQRWYDDVLPRRRGGERIVCTGSKDSYLHDLFLCVAHPPHVVHERVEVVCLGDGDLEGEVARNVARQARQALLSGPAHTYEQHVAAWHAQDPRHRYEVPERVVEKDQIHPVGRKVCVVLLREALLARGVRWVREVGSGTSNT